MKQAIWALIIFSAWITCFKESGEILITLAGGDEKKMKEDGIIYSNKQNLLFTSCHLCLVEMNDCAFATVMGKVVLVQKIADNDLLIIWQEKKGLDENGRDEKLLPFFFYDKENGKLITRTDWVDLTLSIELLHKSLLPMLSDINRQMAKNRRKLLVKKIRVAQKKE